MENYKKWNKYVIGIFIFTLCFVVGTIVVVDPYFHYHKPIFGYVLNNERYQNDGIMRNFEYNALITGTSMTENFKTSEYDDLFGTKSIKVPFSGGSFKEIDQSVKRAISRNKNLKYVLRGLDSGYFLSEKDVMRYETYPTYLYDDNLWNDVYYVLNLDIFMETIKNIFYYNIKHIPSTTFDEYANWNNSYTFGKDAVLASYQRPERQSVTEESQTNKLTEAEIEMEQLNIKQNIIETVNNNPEITFYLFFTPYSIYFWDELNQKGEIKKHIETQKIVIEELLQCKNVKLYSFFDNFQLICNLDNYKDTTHYGEWVNSEILKWIKNNDYLLTEENYISYLKKIDDFYSSYNYDALFE